MKRNFLKCFIFLKVMHRLCYIGVDSLNECSQKTKEKKAKIFVSNYFSNYPRNFTANSAKKKKGPFLPVSLILSGFSNGPEYPDSGSGSKETEMTLTTGQKNEEIACFEELVFLSDILKAFLELGSHSWRHTKRYIQTGHCSSSLPFSSLACSSLVLQY